MLSVRFNTGNQIEFEKITPNRRDFKTKRYQAKTIVVKLGNWFIKNKKNIFSIEFSLARAKTSFKKVFAYTQKKRTAISG